MSKALIIQVFRENRLFVVSLLTLLAICSGIWYATIRQAALVADLQGDWNNKRRQIATRNETLGPDQYSRDKELLRELYSTIPYRHEFPRVISELLDFMALRGATAGTIQYKPIKTDLTGVLAYSMNCSANGSYPALKRLIADLERLDGIATLNEVSFANTDPALEKVDLNLQLTIYLREGRP